MTPDAWELRWRFTIGTFSPAFWAEVVSLQLHRLESGTRAHRERREHPDRIDPLDGFGAAMEHHLGPINADAFFL